MKPAPAEPGEGGGMAAGQLHDGSLWTGRGRARTSSTARHCSATLSSRSMSRSVTHQVEPPCRIKRSRTNTAILARETFSTA